MRFRFDKGDQDRPAGPFRRILGFVPGFDSQATQEVQVGPKAEPGSRYLTRRQCVEFLKLVHDGLGRTMACHLLKLSVSNLKRTLARRPGFRHALEQVEQIRADNLYAVLYTAALRGDTASARFLLARHDRSFRESRGGSRP